MEEVLIEHFAPDTGAALVRWEVNDDDKSFPEVFVHISSPADIDRSRMGTLVGQLSTELETPVRLTVTQIPSFSIDSLGAEESGE